MVYRTWNIGHGSTNDDDDKLNEHWISHQQERGYGLHIMVDMLIIMGAYVAPWKFLHLIYHCCICNLSYHPSLCRYTQILFMSS